MKRLLLFSLLAALPAWSQYTNVTATIVDSSSQPWANGSFSVLWIPTPGQTGPYYWQGALFQPQKYVGTMDGTGTLTITLPDTATITPAGSQWSFVLCSNTTSACSTINVPVTGASEDLSSLFSSRVALPSIYAAPLPRAYSSSEVNPPPPSQGGQFYSVTDNIPYFWTGSVWKALGGTVASVGLSLPNIFSVTGSPVTGSGTLTATLVNQPANTAFANCTSASAAPAFCTLTASMVALAGTLSNSTTGNAATATFATSAGSVPYSGLTGTVPTWNQNTTGNAATATALQTAPTQCTGANVATGIQANGNANCSTVPGLTLKVVGTTGVFTTCTMVGHSSTDISCSGTQAWLQTITGTYYPICTLYQAGFNGSTTADTTGATRFVMGITALTGSSVSYWTSSLQGGATGNNTTAFCVAFQ